MNSVFSENIGLRPDRAAEVYDPNVWWDSPSVVAVEQEHPGLVSGTLVLLDAVEHAPAEFGGKSPDSRFLERAARLHGHLDSAGILLERRRYPSALALARAGFEHALTDRLLLTAKRRRVRYEVEESEFNRLQEAVADRLAGTEDISRLWQPKNKREIVIERDAMQLRMEDGQLTGDFISPYFAVLMHYDPTTGRPSDVDDRLAIHGTAEDQRAAAKRAQVYWNQYLTWSAIVENLLLNDFYSRRDVGRLQAHYAFLSAFAHPTEYGYNRVDHQGNPCHFCTELTILYMGTFAAIELDALLEHCARRMSPEDAEPYRKMVADFNAVSAHLWFPPGEPTILDRHLVVLQLQMREMLENGSSRIAFGRPIVDPVSLTDEQIPYNPDPLGRLIQLHQSQGEISTGLIYTSPWPHPPLPLHP